MAKFSETDHAARKFRAIRDVGLIGSLTTAAAALVFPVPMAFALGVGGAIAGAAALRDKRRLQVPENTSVMLVDINGEKKVVGPGSYFIDLGDTVSIDNIVSTAALSNIRLTVTAQTADVGNDIVLEANFVPAIADEFQIVWEGRGDYASALASLTLELQGLLDDYMDIQRRDGDGKFFTSQEMMDRENIIKKSFTDFIEKNSFGLKNLFGIELLAGTKIMSVGFGPQTHENRKVVGTANAKAKETVIAAEAKARETIIESEAKAVATNNSAIAESNRQGLIIKNAIELGIEPHLAMAADPGSEQVADNRNSFTIGGDPGMAAVFAQVLSQPGGLQIVKDVIKKNDEKPKS